MRKLLLVAFLMPLLCGAGIPVASAVVARPALAAQPAAPGVAPLLLEAQYYRPAPPRRTYRRGVPPGRYYGGSPYARRYAAPRYGYRGPPPRYRGPAPGYYQRRY